MADAVAEARDVAAEYREFPDDLKRDAAAWTA